MPSPKKTSYSAGDILSKPMIPVKRADPGLKTIVLPPLMPPKMATPGLKEIVSREPVLAGDVLSGPDTEFDLKIDSQGYVDKGLFRKFLGQELSGSKLKGFIPKDGKRYGITTGSVDEWADFFHKLAGKESSYKTDEKWDIGRFPPALGRASTDSDGMFMLSPNDALTYRGAYGKHFQNTPYTQEQLVDPIFNTREAIKIMESLLGRSGNPRQGNRIVSDSMFGSFIDDNPTSKTYGDTRYTGPSAYWSPLRRFNEWEEG